MNKKIYIIIIIVLLISIYSYSETSTNKTALIIIDVQDFYFPGGSYELKKPIPASINARKILKHFRKNNLIVIHVKHEVKSGGNIQKNVVPEKNEKVISKKTVNSFLRTDLDKYLKQNNIKNLIICGMQTHMCVEAAIRAGSDLEYKCILIHDACATRDLKFKNYVVKAEDVHNSTLSSLGSYAKIMSTKEFLNKYKKK